jgi:hypothetical protein
MNLLTDRAGDHCGIFYPYVRNAELLGFLRYSRLGRFTRSLGSTRTMCLCSIDDISTAQVPVDVCFYPQALLQFGWR